MKRYLFLLFIVCMAPSFIDQLNTDFQAGTTNNTNITNNSVILANVSGNYTLSGNFTSQVFHLGSLPTGNISWTYNSPSGTSILVGTRSGNSSTFDATWSSWSSNYATNTGSTITSPVRSFYQYRLQLATTNASLTPAVYTVTLLYNETGPVIAAATNQNAVLNENTAGAYLFYITVNDTSTLTNISGRYRIGNDSYTSYSTLTQSGSYYYLSVPQPSGGWTNRENELLYVNFYAANNRSGSDNETYSDLIDNVNILPILNPISNITATEGVLEQVFVSGSDPDLDTITFYSTVGTVVNVSSTQARIDWTPNRTQTGIYNFTVTLSDGIDNVSQVVTANVTDVNDAPVLSAITDQSGYFGDRIEWTLTVTDNDPNENITFYVRPDIFSIRTVNSTGTSNFTYLGIANFSALDPHKGNVSLEFYVTDEIATDNQNATLHIGYCGDAVCQAANENVTSCIQDCESETAAVYVALDIPRRVCSNETSTLTAYQASSRFVCYQEGRTRNNAAFCDYDEDAELTVYLIEDSQRTSESSISAGTDGLITWTPTQTGQYKVIAESSGHITLHQIITVQNCDEINQTRTIIRRDRPEIELEDRVFETPPEFEEPTITQEETSILVLLIWYIIVPILLAGLLYTGNEFYATYKDTNVYLLRMRLKLWEWRQRLAPTFGPILTRIAELVRPLVQLVRTYIIEPAERLLQAIERRLGRR